MLKKPAADGNGRVGCSGQLSHRWFCKRKWSFIVYLSLLLFLYLKKSYCCYKSFLFRMLTFLTVFLHFCILQVHWSLVSLLYQHKKMASQLRGLKPFFSFLKKQFLQCFIFWSVKSRNKEYILLIILLLIGVSVQCFLCVKDL